MRISFPQYCATNYSRNKLDAEADPTALIHLTSIWGVMIALLYSLLNLQFNFILTPKCIHANKTLPCLIFCVGVLIWLFY